MGFPWWALGLVVAVLVIGVAVLFRSFRRWSQPPPGSDPMSRQAEARLWSKMPGEMR